MKCIANFDFSKCFYAASNFNNMNEKLGFLLLKLSIRD